MSAELAARVLARGVSFGSANFTLRRLVLSEGEPPRFAAVVSKKILPHAVDRNYLRRKIYNAIRKSTPSPTARIAVMIFPKKSATTLPFAVLSAEIFSLLQKINTVIPAKAGI